MPWGRLVPIPRTDNVKNASLMPGGVEGGRRMVTAGTKIK